MAFAIVRSYRRPIPGILQMKVLSPSDTLFGDFQRLEHKGDWNAKAFQEMYVPRFLREMRSPEARQFLQALCALDAQGKRIALACYCREERLCHRSIVAGLLQGAGADVRLASNADYSAYYEAYRAQRARRDGA